VERWIEVLDNEGHVDFINPANIVYIQLRGNRQAAQGARVVTTTGTIGTTDQDSIERLRRAAFNLAGLDADGQPRSIPPPPPATSVPRAGGSAESGE
jgi:hypothetical protein